MPRLPEIRFIDESPFNAAYNTRMGQFASQRTSEVAADRMQFETDRDRRKMAEDEAVDTAIRDAIRAQPTRFGEEYFVPSGTTKDAPVSTSMMAAKPVPGAPGTLPGPAVPSKAAFPAPAPAMAAMPAPAAPAGSPGQATNPAAQRFSLERDIASRLAKVKGGGAKALTVMEVARQQEDRWAESAIMAMGNGEIEVFRYYQKKLERAGDPLPIGEDIVKNAAARKMFATALTNINTMYKDDQEQGHVFLKAFLETPGDDMTKLKAAVQRAGAPRSKPDWTMATVLRNGQYWNEFYDKHQRTKPEFTGTPVPAKDDNAVKQYGQTDLVMKARDATTKWVEANIGEVTSAQADQFFNKTLAEFTAAAEQDRGAGAMGGGVKLMPQDPKMLQPEQMYFDPQTGQAIVFDGKQLFRGMEINELLNAMMDVKRENLSR